MIASQESDYSLRFGVEVPLLSTTYGTWNVRSRQLTVGPIQGMRGKLPTPNIPLIPLDQLELITESGLTGRFYRVSSPILPILSIICYSASRVGSCGGSEFEMYVYCFHSEFLGRGMKVYLAVCALNAAITLEIVKIESIGLIGFTQVPGSEH